MDMALIWQAGWRTMAFPCYDTDDKASSPSTWSLAEDIPEDISISRHLST
jgi:hypothetical protein